MQHWQLQDPAVADVTSGSRTTKNPHNLPPQFLMVSPPSNIRGSASSHSSQTPLCLVTLPSSIHPPRLNLLACSPQNRSCTHHARCSLHMLIPTLKNPQPHNAMVSRGVAKNVLKRTLAYLCISWRTVRVSDWLGAGHKTSVSRVCRFSFP